MSERNDGDKPSNISPNDSDLEKLLTPLPSGMQEIPVEEIAEALRPIVLSSQDTCDPFRGPNYSTLDGKGAPIVQHADSTPNAIHDIGVEPVLNDVGAPQVENDIGVMLQDVDGETCRRCIRM